MNIESYPVSKNHRLIVTGQHENGKSCILRDDSATKKFGLPGVLEIYPLWESDSQHKIPLTHNDLMTEDARNEMLLPERGGSKFVLEVAWPEKTGFDDDDAREMFKSLGALNSLKERDGASHAGMHQTDTVDYLVILSGEIHLILENEEVLLKAGDMVVQSGVLHTWANRSSAPCLILAVIMSCDRKPSKTSSY